VNEQKEKQAWKVSIPNRAGKLFPLLMAIL